ncbi:MAG: sigma-70 family RNA polymerase sigma factor [Bacteroidota bacterium]
MTATTAYLAQSKKYTEEFLCSELKSKSKLAFEYLYDNYSPALYGVIFNILHHEEASNDALQEVFVKIWNNFESYDPQRSRLYTWMMNIARNHAIDKLRSKAMKGEHELKRDKDFARNIHATTSQFVDGIGLKKMVDQLEKEQKDIIDLLYFRGFTQSEVAEELSIPLGTVKSRVRLAMNKLRKYFI